MSNCCCELGLLQDIGPIIEGLRSENDRMVATCVLMTLLKYFNDNSSDFIKSVTINGNIITFTKNDGTTIDILLPTDEYVNGAEISGNNLVLKRLVGNDITIDLSSISTSIDTSRFFTSCTLSGNTLIFKNGDTELQRVNLKDGMLTSVSFTNNNLVFTWNSDAGISQLTISLAGLITTDTNTYINSGSLEHNQSNDHYYILLNYNDTTKNPISVDLNDFEANILAKFPLIPGYYKGKTYQSSSNFNTQDTEYLGTTWNPETLKPTSVYRYIFKVVSKTNYSIVASYKLPRDGYYYVLASGNNAVKYNVVQNSNVNITSKKIPSGVIGIIYNDNGTLKVLSLPNFFIYFEVKTADAITNPSSISYSDIKTYTSDYSITTTDNLGNTATAINCMFYPSRFIDNNNFIGKHDWDNTDNALVEEFNNVLIDSGFRYMFEIKYKSTVDDVNILSEQSSDFIIGDTADGLRYTYVREGLLTSYLGKAKYQNNLYVAAGPWPNSDDPNNYVTGSSFKLTSADSWKDIDSLELIWSYIMTQYFNSKNPDTAVSSICYSDNTGWYTTWRSISILNNSYGTVLNANTECNDGEVVNPGNDPLPTISPDNMPCSNFIMTFNALIDKLSVYGRIKLNVGSRSWDFSNTPYRYYEFNTPNTSASGDPIVLKYNLLYKTTLKDCNFVIQYRNDSDELVFEHVKYNNGALSIKNTKSTLSTPL